MQLLIGMERVGCWGEELLFDYCADITPGVFFKYVIKILSRNTLADIILPNNIIRKCLFYRYM